MSLGTSAMLSLYQDYRCSPARYESITLFNRAPCRFVPTWVPAFLALEQTLVNLGYPDDPNLGIISTYVCKPYLHGNALAVDIHPNLNSRYWGEPGSRQRLITMPQGRAVEQIRFNDGAQAFRWGMWFQGTHPVSGKYQPFPDPMHFQAAAAPQSVATGIDYSTVIGGGDVLTFCKRVLGWWSVDDLVRFHGFGWWKANTSNVRAAAEYFKSPEVDDGDVISIVTEILGKAARDWRTAA